MKKIKPLAVISSVIIVIGIIFIARFNSIFSLSEGEIKIYDEPYAPAADVSKLAVADDTMPFSMRMRATPDFIRWTGLLCSEYA